MKVRYAIQYRDDRPNEEIECDAMKQAENTVVFMNQTSTVDAGGQPGLEVALVTHWDDIREIRKVESSAPTLALAT